jgi:hypothetical protein
MNEGILEMKIAIIAPGEMPIPPKGWGAVESIIHEYQIELEKQGHQVLVVNTKSRNKIIQDINSYNPDFVHCQYDEFIDVLSKVNCRFKAITSHYGYLDQVWEHEDYLFNIHEKIVQAKDVYIFALSQSIADKYINDGVSPGRVYVVPNGVNFENFSKSSEPLYPNKSIYLAKIDSRKRQGLIQSLNENVDFAGNLCSHTAISSGFNPSDRSYLGEWSKTDVYTNLTNYSSLVLLSDGEAHPLVCLEGLSSGLGLVLSEFATANLDTSLPFIDVIPESKMSDFEYVRQVIRKNRSVSLKHRYEIMKYASKFDWIHCVKNYVNLVSKIILLPPLSVNKQKIAIVTVATGKYYDEFIPNLKKSVDKFLYKNNREINFYCFTDHIPEDPTIIYLESNYFGWPFDTLLRYSLFKKNFNDLMRNDFILYLDADMEIVSTLDHDFFNEKLVAVQHPGFIKKYKVGTFELDESESTYVPLKFRKMYYQGCFWGGRSIYFKHMIQKLAAMVDFDLAISKIPIWHDESYLNYFLSVNQCLALPPSYAYPQHSKLNLSPIVIHKIKSHNHIRSIAYSNVSSKDIIDGMSLEKKLDFYRALYLSAHEKNQRLELCILKYQIFENLLTIYSPLNYLRIFRRSYFKNLLRKIYRKIRYYV